MSKNEADRPPELVPEQIGDDRYRAQNVGNPEEGDVVFGGQLMSQLIVIAADRNPGKNVKTLHTIFARGARVSQTTEIEASSMHDGRSFGSETLTVWQGDRLCARALVLLSADEPDLIQHTSEMPSVAGPETCSLAGPAGLAFPGAEFRIVGDVDTWNPEAPTGPPELYVWMRHPTSSDEQCVNQAILAYATDGFLIGAAMRPHAGYGQDRAHVDLATGVVSHTMTFHEPFSVGSWSLLAQEVVYTGRGRVYGRSNVFCEDGTLAASFVQDSIIRK